MFNSESDLVRQFKPHSRRFISKIIPTIRPQKYFIINEFDSGNGIADIIVGTYRPRLSEQSMRSPINLNWVSLLATMNRNKKLNIDEFTELYGYSKKTAMLQIREYENAGFIELLNDNIFIVKKEYKSVVENVVAIEAKLKNWKQALKQAYRYRRFSDFSIVLMDADNVTPALKAENVFMEYGIGLASLNEKGCKILISPAKNDRKNNDSFHRINEEALGQFRAL